MKSAVVFLVAYMAVAYSSWVPDMENNGLYEGDMVLSPEQMNEVADGTFTFSSTSNRNKLWPNAVVPYEVSYELQREPKLQRELEHSIQQYHKYTCLRFKKRTNERAYISFYKGGGCSSPVGYTGGRNRISLSKGCWWRSTIMHEIGHSLGFHHEQSRPDRDNYVTILFQNIARGTEFNFRKQSYENTDSKGTPYDYRSMMHYSWDAFGSGKMTIRTKDPSMQYELGQGQGNDNGFSHVDIQQLNLLYSCSGTYPTLPPYVKPPKGCYDLGSCGSLVYEGACKKSAWRSYMSKKCRRSCGLCGDGPEPTEGPVVTEGPIVTEKPTSGGGGGDCRDRVIDCHRLGRHRCNDDNPAWKNYMHRSCKRYCNLC